MSDYPDNPSSVVKALRRALFLLFKQHRFDEAADYALCLKEPVIRYSPIEIIADRIYKKRSAQALELYAVALQSAREDAASAPSGAEGTARRAEVMRLEKKLAARGKESKKPAAKAARRKATTKAKRTAPAPARRKASSKAAKRARKPPRRKARQITSRN